VWGEHEEQRSLAAAAHVLEAAGERHLAARAIGRAHPFQDMFVDTIGTVRARLTEHLDASSTETLVAEGAASELPELVTERAALAALKVKRRE
jgi:hypothetical protein